MNTDNTCINENLEDFKKKVKSAKRKMKTLDDEKSQEVSCILKEIIEKIDRVNFQAKSFLERSDVQK